MTFTPSDIKTLREKTGAGMMDLKPFKRPVTLITLLVKKKV